MAKCQRPAEGVVTNGRCVFAHNFPPPVLLTGSAATISEQAIVSKDKPVDSTVLLPKGVTVTDPKATETKAEVTDVKAGANPVSPGKTLRGGRVIVVDDVPSREGSVKGEISTASKDVKVETAHATPSLETPAKVCNLNHNNVFDHLAQPSSSPGSVSRASVASGMGFSFSLYPRNSIDNLGCGSRSHRRMRLAFGMPSNPVQQVHQRATPHVSVCEGVCHRLRCLQNAQCRELHVCTHRKHALTSDRSHGAEDTSDDATSVKAMRKRKSEKERIEWFREDRACEQLEPHRVFCKGCHQWIDLHPKLKYVMKTWIAHRRTCRYANF